MSCRLMFQLIRTEFGRLARSPMCCLRELQRALFVGVSCGARCICVLAVYRNCLMNYIHAHGTEHAVDVESCLFNVGSFYRLLVVTCRPTAMMMLLMFVFRILKELTTSLVSALTERELALMAGPILMAFLFQDVWTEEVISAILAALRFVIAFCLLLMI